ncbi:SCO2322 family protein [Streptomyces solincola]|uniref:SCO2322 family protein n=1 Tax=Streptomyces solincola TaxID=2100817 RepID=UPI0021594315|nr:SCO2322 family protein [Streptomyces solincola]
MTARRRPPALLAAVLTLTALTVLGAAPAQAAGYRYWSFWESAGGTWTYATQGPATARPADGDVNGYRFAVSADSADAATPRRTPDFAAICGSGQAPEGAKRIAVVLDFGTAADAPQGERPPERRQGCARVPADATSAEALAAVAKPLRYDSAALLCAISGYPRTGCGEQVAAAPSTRPTGPDASAAPASDEDSGGPSVGVAAGAAAVAVLAAAAVWQARRRRR